MARDEEVKRVFFQFDEDVILAFEKGHLSYRAQAYVYRRSRLQSTLDLIMCHRKLSFIVAEELHEQLTCLG